MLRQNAANSELRSMLASFCLRRSKQAIGLPNRNDTMHKLELAAEEAAHYTSINLRITDFLEQQAEQTNVRTYSNILTKINSLRQICNLGTCYQGNVGDGEDQTAAMQEVFDEMISAGTAVCCKCNSDLSVADERNETQDGGMHGLQTSQTRIATCGKIICHSCLADAETTKCPSNGGCQHKNLCELFVVDPSRSSGLPATQPPSQLPTKMRALQEDLLALPKTDKRYSSKSVNACLDSHDSSIVFSFWTTTLDLAGAALDRIHLPYTRVDGTMLAKQRQLALEKFVGDPLIRSILISLRCGANGCVKRLYTPKPTVTLTISRLNLTAANHVFLMEPQWNPMIEDQALDRVHRIGQTKEVATVRYIVKNTLEEVRYNNFDKSSSLRVKMK